MGFLKYHRYNRTGFFFIILFVVFSSIGMVLAKEPKFFIKEKNHDFGIVNQGKMLSHVFLFSNTGDEMLYIRKVSAG